MSDITPETIIARFDRDAQQWSAWFERMPQVAFGGDLPVVAIRRLLEGTEAPSDMYSVNCDGEVTGSGSLRPSIVWDAPELLVPCPDCEGRGEYVGLLDRRACPTCRGRKVVAG